jgi:NitT/TauT family transport system permease protein/sulfonate transport system permease protein
MAMTSEAAGGRGAEVRHLRPIEGTATGRAVFRRPGPAELEPRKHRRRRRRLELTLSILVPVSLVLLWQLASSSEWIDTRFFPSPTTIWSAAVGLVETGELQDHLFVSLRRVLIGYAVGSAAGVVVGVLLAMSRLTRAAFEPLIYALYTVPKLALLPLLLLIFGIGEMPMLVLIAVNCFFLVFIPTMAALVAVPFPDREAADSFQASRWQMLRHVGFPQALPQIFVALRLTAGASILVLVAVEFVQSREGMGFLIWNSWSLFLADRMYVGIVVIAVCGALFTLLVTAIGRKLSPWARES